MIIKIVYSILDTLWNALADSACCSALLEPLGYPQLWRLSRC
jgi:hypothetical protein